MATGRKLVSASAAAATGLHSASNIVLSADEATVCFWLKVNADNTFNTIWASDSGQEQIFSGSGGTNRAIRVRADGGGGAQGDPGAGQLGNWCWFVARIGNNHSGSNDVTIEVWDALGNQLASDADGSGVSSELSSSGTHWVLGDDNSGGVNTDDGFKGEIFDLCLFEGIVANADLPYDTTTGEAKEALSPAAAASVVYRLRGENVADPGADNSGNGNSFTVENGGVTLSDTDLPPVQSSGGTVAAGDGSSDGAASATGEGAAVAQGDGTAAGAAAAAGDGASVAEGDGTSSGGGSASGDGQIGGTVQAGEGTSDGSASASGEGGAIASGDGTSAGGASGTGEGAATAEAQGSSDGSSTASAGGVVDQLVSYPEGDPGSAEFEGSLDAGWTLQPGTEIPAFDGWSVVDGKLRCSFLTGQDCDPGIGSTTSGLGAPRVETAIADTDFDVYVQLREDPRFYTCAFTGYGFVVRGAGASGRFDIFAQNGAESTNAFVRTGSTTHSVTAPPDGFPAFLHLNRTGDTFELRTSKDGTNWDLIVSAVWAETVTHVGVSCWQINDGGDPATLEIESIHLGQAGLPVLNGEGGRTVVATPALNDLTGLVDASANGGSISAAGGVLTMSCTAPDQSTARFTLDLGDVEADQGLLFRCRNAGTLTTDTYFGAVLRGQSKGALEWAGQYAPPAALVFEGNPRLNLVRLLHTAGYHPSNNDGANWSYNYTGNDPALDMDAGWVWVRMEAIGPFLRYRAWSDGAQEPASWTAEVNNTLIEGAGKIGIGFSKNDGTGASGSMEVADLEAYSISAVANVIASGDGAASGSSTADAVGQAVAEGSGSADGDSSASGQGQSVGSNTGQSAGSSTASGDGQAVAEADGASGGGSGASGEGESTAEGAGSSAGSSGASGAGSDATENVGQSDGSSTASGDGQAIATGDGSSDGSAAAGAAGQQTTEAQGASAGGSTATGENITEGVFQPQTPPDRVLVVRAERRVFTVPAEDRTVRVAA